MANKEDVYIKDGRILRGPKATEELFAHDIEEIIRDAGLESQIQKKVSPCTKSVDKKENNDTTPDATASSSLPQVVASTESDKASQPAEGASASVNSPFHHDVEEIIQKAGSESRIKLKLGEFTVNEPAIKSSAEALKAKENNIEITGVATSICCISSWCKVKAKNVEGEAMSVSAGAPNASMSAEGANITTLNASGHMMVLDIGGDIGATVNAVSLKAMNVSMSGAKGIAYASAMVTAKGVDVKACNADITGTESAAEAEVVLTAKGADIKVGNAKITGVQTTAKAEAQAAATGLDVDAASARVVGYKKHCGVGASAQAKAIEVKAATANIVGIEDKSEITCEARAVGHELRAANISITGEKRGASAKATIQAQGTEVEFASVNVQGQDSSTSAQAEVKVGAASARVASANINPQSGTHFQARVVVIEFIKHNVQPGVHLWNSPSPKHNTNWQ